MVKFKTHSTFNSGEVLILSTWCNPYYVNTFSTLYVGLMVREYVEWL